MPEVAIYEAEGGAFEVRVEQETVWLTQAQMGELFQRDQSVISRHISNVFKEGELEGEPICRKCILVPPTCRQDAPVVA